MINWGVQKMLISLKQYYYALVNINAVVTRTISVRWRSRLQSIQSILEQRNFICEIAGSWCSDAPSVSNSWTNKVTRDGQPNFSSSSSSLLIDRTLYLLSICPSVYLLYLLLYLCLRSFVSCSHSWMKMKRGHGPLLHEGESYHIFTV